jgi:hypothetical protein
MLGVSGDLNAILPGPHDVLSSCKNDFARRRPKTRNAFRALPGELKRHSCRIYCVDFVAIFDSAVNLKDDLSHKPAIGNNKNNE